MESSMRFVRTFLLWAGVFVVNVNCGGGGSKSGCTGQQAVCPGQPYAACVNVQNAPGECVDWSMVGASPCSTGPSDCPATRPSASFPGGGSSSAVCVKETDIQFGAGAASPGYCAAIAAYTDSSGAATCTPNPCGTDGYCSFVHSAAGAVVSCIWPI